MADMVEGNEQKSRPERNCCPFRVPRSGSSSYGATCPTPSRGPTQFAQYAVYAPVIPVEASPVRGRSLAALLTTGGATGAMILYGATRDPAAAALYAAGVTILFTAAYPVFLRLEAAVARLMDVELERPAGEDEPGEPS